MVETCTRQVSSAPVIFVGLVLSSNKLGTNCTRTTTLVVLIERLIRFERWIALTKPSTARKRLFGFAQGRELTCQKLNWIFTRNCVCTRLKVIWISARMCAWHPGTVVWISARMCAQHPVPVHWNRRASFFSSAFERKAGLAFCMHDKHLEDLVHAFDVESPLLDFACKNTSELH